jgi:hypothetical protein
MTTKEIDSENCKYQVGNGKQVQNALVNTSAGVSTGAGIRYYSGFTYRTLCSAPYRQGQNNNRKKYFFYLIHGANLQKVG